jgi:hypothetical protein
MGIFYDDDNKFSCDLIENFLKEQIWRIITTAHYLQEHESQIIF